MTGFPLQFYAHLDSLREAYETTKTVTLKNDECHINFNEASEDLPDITLMETETYALIRDNVSFVIRAIILQAINWREGMLKVAVPDKYGTGRDRDAAGHSPPSGHQVRVRKDSVSGSISSGSGTNGQTGLLPATGRACTRRGG